MYVCVCVVFFIVVFLITTVNLAFILMEGEQPMLDLLMKGFSLSVLGNSTSSLCRSTLLAHVHEQRIIMTLLKYDVAKT